MTELNRITRLHGDITSYRSNIDFLDSLIYKIEYVPLPSSINFIDASDNSLVVRFIISSTMQADNFGFKYFEYTYDKYLKRETFDVYEYK